MPVAHSPLPHDTDTAAAVPSTARALGTIAAALVVGAAILAAPSPEGLPPAAQRVAALFATCLILWVAEAIPIAVTALLAIVLQAVAGVAPLTGAVAAFMSPVFFFVMVMFVIAQAFTNTGLDRRFACWLLAQAGGSTRRTVMLFMAGTAALSTVVSDVPSCAVFMAVALGLFDKMGLRPGASHFAKCLMIGIPVASLIGGVGTPAGSSVNILGLTFIERYGQVRVPFVHWMAIGIPMVIVLVPVAAAVILWFYPPELDRIEGINFRADLDAMGPVTSGEWKVVALMSTMLGLWVASSWIRSIDVVVVAILGAAAMFLPGMRLFRSWQEAERGTAWDTLLMIGSVTSLGAVSASSGLAKWLVDASLGGIDTWSPAAVVATVNVFIVVIHLLVPVNPAIIAAMVPPIVLLATSTGHNPALYALPVVFTASCAFLLPLDAVPLVTYGKGYYRMFDMFLPGAVISVVWVTVLTTLLLTLGPLLGLL
jgi:solute carrier family 13 (sodium-dependent dicarboxylate transporter), member 2/3/5